MCPPASDISTRASHGHFKLDTSEDRAVLSIPGNDNPILPVSHAETLGSLWTPPSLLSSPSSIFQRPPGSNGVSPPAQLPPSCEPPSSLTWSGAGLLQVSLICQVHGAAVLVPGASAPCSDLPVGKSRGPALARRPQATCPSSLPSPVSPHLLYSAPLAHLPPTLACSRIARHALFWGLLPCCSP